ncbi:MAG TPA: hypothetical protein VG873_16060 [Burkholderiales bacterium]|jgi:uncharacterized protein YjbJ (UPF0337 family)|nr:hypothetical protein [Burkholderiales bacterium]
MDWTQVETSWDKYLVAAKQQWGKLSEEQIAATRGRYDVLSARVREAYGLTRQQSDFQLSEWLSRQQSR